MKRNPWVVPLVASLAGAASWFIVVAIVGDRDPMSHAEYLAVGYPLLLIVATVLGWKLGPSAWHSGLWMLGTQLLIGFVTISGNFNLLPLGLLIFLVLAAGCSVLAVVSGFVARRMHAKSTEH